MKKPRILPLALIIVAALAGCSTMPASDSPLAQAHIAYTSAQADPQVTSLAASELKQASDSLERADRASSKGESGATVDHLAYVAKQQVFIAQETAKQKSAELAVANASAERDRVRLIARTREADSAQRSAEISQRQAEASQRQAEASQRSAEASQRQTIAERQAANDAQLGAQAARQQTMDAEARSQQLDAQLREMEAKKTDRGMVITLGDVLFDSGRAQLKPGGIRNVQKVADFFKQYPQRKVMIEGFTDSIGSHNSNQELSDQRAGSVRTALLDMGVSTDRISSRGYGESYPVAANDTATGRQMNRRVEIIVSDNSGNIAPR